MLVGWVGYMVFGDLGPLDSLYMTVITVATVGYREVAEPTTATKILTIGLIGAGVGAVSYAAVTGVEFVVEGHLSHYLERRRMDRAIDNLDDHVIICGFGRVGRNLSHNLDDEQTPFVVIDDDEGKVEDAEAEGYLVLRGDATEEGMLESAGLDRVRALVATVNSDADNVLITLTAKGLRPDCQVIARAKSEENEPKLRRAGADRVIQPSTIGGRRIAQILTRPVVADFLDNIGGGGVDYTLEEVPVALGSELAGVTLRDAAIRKRFGVTVLAVRHAEDQRLDSHPSPDVSLEVGDTLVIMGSDDEVSAMRRHFVGH
nr:potassium channel protein [Salsipaludibacter albus]